MPNLQQIRREEREIDREGEPRPGEREQAGRSLRPEPLEHAEPRHFAGAADSIQDLADRRGDSNAHISGETFDGAFDRGVHMLAHDGFDLLRQRIGELEQNRLAQFHLIELRHQRRRRTFA